MLGVLQPTNDGEVEAALDGHGRRLQQLCDELDRALLTAHAERVALERLTQRADHLLVEFYRIRRGGRSGVHLSPQHLELAIGVWLPPSSARCFCASRSSFRFCLTRPRFNLSSLLLVLRVVDVVAFGGGEHRQPGRTAEPAIRTTAPQAHVISMSERLERQ